MNIKAVVLDVDGTLTNENDGTLVESNIEACRKLQEKGIKVIIASGRAPVSMPVIEGKIFPDYYVGANGSQLCDKDKKVLWAHYVDRKLFEDLNSYCQQHQIGIFWKFTDASYVYSDAPLMREIQKSLKTFFCYPNPDPTQLPTAGSMTIDPDQLEDFRKNFAHRIGIVNGGWAVYDLDDFGIDKASGLLKLLEIIGIDKKDVMAFGDSENDRTVLMQCGVGVCMGNGFDSIKQIADYVTDKSSCDGIIKALKHFEIL